MTRNLKGRVGDRVGSSPTTSTKKTFGSFFVGGTLHFVQQMLCIWNPQRVAGARLCLSVSGVKLTLDCTSHQPHQTKGIEDNTSPPFFVVHTHFYTYFFANFRANFFVKKHDILQRKRIFEKANIKHFKKCAKKFILQNNQVLLPNLLHILYNDERRNFV